MYAQGGSGDAGFSSLAPLVAVNEAREKIMNHRAPRASPVVRAAVLVCGLLLLAVAGGGYAHGQPVITDHRKPNETTKPGYAWVKDHWERVQAPAAGAVVPPPAQMHWQMSHSPLRLAIFTGGPLTCSLICRDKYDECLTRGR
jgi:hypothetical protein